jgi:4'-phosphopantetheinyl transferase
LTDSAVEVVMARLDVTPETAGELARCLSGTERERARRFAFERDRRRFIVARARLRHLLAARLGSAPEEIDFTTGSHGKPGLSGGDWTFNASRSGDVAGFAFSRGREIGIDIETVRDLPEADTIAARFFSRRENEDYLALSSADKATGFFNCWTRKEAFVKAIGDGLSHPLDRFDVSLAPGEPARILRVGSGWSLHAFIPGPGLVGAVAVSESLAVQP